MPSIVEIESVLAMRCANGGISTRIRNCENNPVCSLGSPSIGLCVKMSGNVFMASAAGRNNGPSASRLFVGESSIVEIEAVLAMHFANGGMSAPRLFVGES